MTQILTFWVAKYTASLPLFEGSIVPYLAALHEFIGELPVELIEQVRAVQTRAAEVIVLVFTNCDIEKD